MFRFLFGLRKSAFTMRMWSSHVPWAWLVILGFYVHQRRFRVGVLRSLFRDVAVVFLPLGSVDGSLAIF